MEGTIWISWEDHRRTQELAKAALGVPLIIPSSSFGKGISHIHLALKTLVEIVEKKPEILIVQNPSVILAFVASVAKFIFKYYLVVDRHTNFRLGKSIFVNPVHMLYMFFSNFSLRHADLTIVTNGYLKKVVEDKGGRGFILEDKLPTFDKVMKRPLQGKFNVVFICTYANDEPYKKVVRSATLLPVSICIYITGKVPKALRQSDLSANIILTGYLPEQEYANLLFSADVIMDFTTLDWCLVCGGYEAVSLGKPFITSDTVALRELFGDAAIYSNHNPLNIAACVKKAQNMHCFYKKRVETYRGDFLRRWNRSFSDLQKMLSRFGKNVV